VPGLRTGYPAQHAFVHEVPETWRTQQWAPSRTGWRRVGGTVGFIPHRRQGMPDECRTRGLPGSDWKIFGLGVSGGGHMDHREGFLE
jgi:hypothetical protein